MPDGPEKEKKLKRFNRDIAICIWGYAIMLIVMMGLTFTVIIAVIIASL